MNSVFIRKLALLAALPLLAILAACTETSNAEGQAPPAPPKEAAAKKEPAATPVKKLVLTDAQWRKRLTPDQYNVLRNKDTECAFGGAYWKTHGDGIFTCAGCGQVLFDTKDKFDSGTGWPSFFQPGGKNAVETEKDEAHGMVRTEVHCSRCDGHLGHVFDDGPKPTGLRYCINSAALVFTPRDKLKENPKKKAKAETKEEPKAEMKETAKEEPPKSK